MKIDKVSKRFKEFLNTYPEDMRHKVSAANVIGLMEWAYKEGVKDAGGNLE